MKDTLAAGLERTERYEVTDEMSPPHLPNKVLSTPSMVGLIEQTCLLLAQEHLDAPETTVGIHVCVSHAASASSGESVDIHVRLAERDRKKLTFDTRVTAGDKVVSEGTHQRFVVAP